MKNHQTFEENQRGVPEGQTKGNGGEKIVKKKKKIKYLIVNERQETPNERVHECHLE